MKTSIFLIFLAIVMVSCSPTTTQPMDTPIPPTDTPELIPTDVPTSIPPTDTPELTPTDIPTSIPSTPDATADWPVYENAVLGYSFKYPSGCFFGPMPANCKENPLEERPPECLCFLDTDNPNEVFMQALIAGEGEGFLMVSFNVAHYDSDLFNPPAGVELISWLNENLSFPPDLMPGETNYILDGLPAAWISIPGGQGGAPMDGIYFIWKDKLITISMHDMENDRTREIYEQILSSFQLIE
jgi:hypothetical protein